MMTVRKANSKATKRSKREAANTEESLELTELARKINVKLNGIRDGLRTSVLEAIEAGALLIEAKAAQNHGRFCKWCLKHFKVSSRQLQKYMQLAKYVRDAKANSSSDLRLSLKVGSQPRCTLFRYGKRICRLSSHARRPKSSSAYPSMAKKMMKRRARGKTSPPATAPRKTAIARPPKTARSRTIKTAEA
jgi:hypothetical protein